MNQSNGSVANELATDEPTADSRPPAPSAPAAASPGAAAPATSWVINLSASTTPMTLARPAAPELARFTFFVSRRREEGRERFRLHMGYFASREEAEQMLDLVREVYPAAWVGEAPGRRLRTGGAAPAAATPAPAPAPAAAAAVPPASAAGKTATAARAVATATTAAASPAAAANAAPPAASPQAAAPSAPVAPAAEAGRTRITPVASLSPHADLTDSQVLRVLEQRVDRATQAVSTDGAAVDEAAGAISLLSPEDTQSWRDIRSQLAQDAAVYFAVQLEWSVSPIELGRVPELAIFNAYTLYRIEGSRQGRRWYGLRLGFFKDALSAKQVAYYVRSEFAAVAVVPVSARERGQARDYGAIALPKADPRAKRGARDEEITLIDDRPARPARTAPAGAPASPVGTGAPPAVAQPAAAEAPGPARRTGRPRGGPPKSLEETLEILGASQLSIESGRHETLLDGASRPPPDRRTTVFSKLLERLTDKLRK